MTPRTDAELEHAANLTIQAVAELYASQARKLASLKRHLCPVHSPKAMSRAELTEAYRRAGIIGPQPP